MKNKRLAMIFTWVAKNLNVADIGSDHGKLSIKLSEISNHVYATEYYHEPYLQLLKNINKSQIKNITVLQGNGLKPLKNISIDIVIIAGMGGNTIVDILNTAFENKYIFKNIIIAPQNNTAKVRLILKNNNFAITKETILKEKGVYYNIIKAVKSDATNIKNDKDILIGPLFEKNDTSLEYINIKYLELKNINKHRNNIQIQNNLSIIKKLIKSW